MAETPHCQCRGPQCSTLGQGTRSHMPQLKILDATAKTGHSQISKYKSSLGHLGPTVTDAKLLFDFSDCH